MQHGQKLIKDLFNTRTIFNIPEYQRAYAWEEEQLEDFVEDLENQRLDPRLLLRHNSFSGTTTG